MPDELKKEDPAKDEAIDKSKYIPKDEYDKLKTTVDKLQADLLSDDYIAFLETKSKPKEKTDDKPDSKPTGDVSIQIASLQQQLQTVAKNQQNIADFLEVREAESKHPDFNDFRKDIVEILESAETEITVEGAYEKAKYRRAEKTGEPIMVSRSSERPGGSAPASTVTPKEYKTQKEADDDTARIFKEKFGVQGDRI